MARYDITNVALAEELGVRKSSVSNWRTSKTLPRLGGERLDEICRALSKLARRKINFADLFEEVEEFF